MIWTTYSQASSTMTTYLEINYVRITSTTDQRFWDIIPVRGTSSRYIVFAYNAINNAATTFWFGATALVLYGIMILMRCHDFHLYLQQKKLFFINPSPSRKICRVNSDAWKLRDVVYRHVEIFVYHTCSAGEVRNVLPSVAAVEPSSSEPAAEAVASL